MKITLKLFPLILLMGALSFTYIGCGDVGGLADSEGSVIMYISKITDPGTGEYYINSDVISDAGTIYQDDMNVTVRVIPKGQTSPNDELYPTSDLMDVIVTDYRVDYERIDGGTAVPDSFSGKCSQQVDVNSEASFILQAVDAEAKLLPPLEYLADPGYEPDTGLIIITCNLKLTIWGHTISGDKLSATGYIVVYFSNWVG